jgi:soluble cytochrome b562
MAVTYYNAARAYEDLQDYSTAIKHAERSVERARLASGPDHSGVKKYQEYLDRLREKQ